jgi:hypothetical protein
MQTLGFFSDFPEIGRDAPSTIGPYGSRVIPIVNARKICRASCALSKPHTRPPAIFLDEFDASRLQGCSNPGASFASATKGTVLSFQSLYRWNRNIRRESEVLL